MTPSMRAPATRAGTFAVALVVCACWFPADRGQRLERRVDRIEGEGPAPGGEGHAAADEQARRTEERLAELQKQVEALRAAPKAQGAAAAPDPRLAQEVERLRASIEQQARRLDGLEKAQARADASRAAERRSVRPAERSARREPPAPAREPAPPEKPPAEPREAPAAPGGAAPGGKTGLLALAREQESRGDKAVARDLYQEYVEKFPADPETAEARFRLGEMAYGEKRYQDAVREFGLVAKDFPNSHRAPEALLRTADAMMALDLRDDARSVLAEIPKRYPGTPAAARARQRLAEAGAGEKGK